MSDLLKEEPKKVVKIKIPQDNAPRSLKERGKEELLEIIKELQEEAEVLYQRLSKAHIIYLSLMPLIALLCFIGLYVI
jgi:hypothetical protein